MSFALDDDLNTSDEKNKLKVNEVDDEMKKLVENFNRRNKSTLQKQITRQDYGLFKCGVEYICCSINDSINEEFDKKDISDTKFYCSLQFCDFHVSNLFCKLMFIGEQITVKITEIGEEINIIMFPIKSGEYVLGFLYLVPTNVCMRLQELGITSQLSFNYLNYRLGLPLFPIGEEMSYGQPLSNSYINFLGLSFISCLTINPFILWSNYLNDLPSNTSDIGRFGEPEKVKFLYNINSGEFGYDDLSNHFNLEINDLDAKYRNEYIVDNDNYLKIEEPDYCDNWHGMDDHDKMFTDYDRFEAECYGSDDNYSDDRIEEENEQERIEEEKLNKKQSELLEARGTKYYFAQIENNAITLFVKIIYKDKYYFTQAVIDMFPYRGFLPGREEVYKGTMKQIMDIEPELFTNGNQFNDKRKELNVFLIERNKVVFEFINNKYGLTDNYALIYSKKFILAIED